MKNIPDKKKRIMFIVPLPPPYAGPEAMSKILLDTSLKDQFDIIHVRNNMHQCNSQRGKVTVFSISKFYLLIINVIRQIIFKRPAVMYTLLSQNFTGVMRDSLLILLAKMVGRKTVLHFHGANFHNFYERQSYLVRKYIHFVLNLADIIIVQAQYVKDIFKRWVPESRIHILYNGIPLNMSFQKVFRQKTFTREKVTVLYLNHIMVSKGFLVLLKAIPQIVKENAGINFVIAGDIVDKERNILFGQRGDRINLEFDNMTAAIEQILHEEYVKKNVKFLGLVTDSEEKDKLLMQSDMFVLPSYSEGCPMSVLEAMMAGLPVIVTSVGALPEMIKEEENGFLLEPGDVNRLVEKILYLAYNPHLRKTIGENNQLLIQSKFDIDIIAPQMASIFKLLHDDEMVNFKTKSNYKMSQSGMLKESIHC